MKTDLQQRIEVAHFFRCRDKSFHTLHGIPRAFNQLQAGWGDWAGVQVDYY
jgi:hypothetical protein